MIEGEVVWSINIMIAILLVGVGVVIYYIFMYDELWPNGSNGSTKSEELLQLPSDQSESSS